MSLAGPTAGSAATCPSVAQMLRHPAAAHGGRSSSASASGPERIEPAAIQPGQRRSPRWGRSGRERLVSRSMAACARRPGSCRDLERRGGEPCWATARLLMADRHRECPRQGLAGLTGSVVARQCRGGQFGTESGLVRSRERPSWHAAGAGQAGLLSQAGEQPRREARLLGVADPASRSLRPAPAGSRPPRRCLRHRSPQPCRRTVRRMSASPASSIRRQSTASTAVPAWMPDREKARPPGLRRALRPTRQR